MHNAIKKSLPGALTIVISIALLQIIKLFVPVTPDELEMVSVILLAAGAFSVLFRVCLPMDIKHAVIFFGMLAIFFLGWGIMPGLFSVTPIDKITKGMLLLSLPLIAVTVPILLIMTKALNKFFETKEFNLLNRLNL